MKTQSETIDELAQKQTIRLLTDKDGKVDKPVVKEV